jgi:RNA polymerase sigma-70 factor (ECF subfamily)
MSRLEFSHKFMSMESMLRAFAHSLTKNEEAAEDLFQETAYKAFKYRERFHPTTNLKAWLLTIMKNTFINDYRRRKRQQVLQDYTSNDFLINSGKTTGNSGEGKILLDEVQKAINELEPNLRQPFLMQYQGYQYDEIADALNIPLGTVKSRIHFARRRLRKRLGGWYQTNRMADILN